MINEEPILMKKGANLISVIVDDRERRSGVIDSLRQKNNVAVHVRHMPCGDYLVGNQLVFERKTLNDFATSLIDGRLLGQANRLACSSVRAVYILEGTGKDMTYTGVRREAIQGALITISLVLGLPVLRSRNPVETADLILYAARQVTLVARSGLKRYGYRPKGKRKRQLFILQGLPGIGRERANRLLDKFGSVEAIMNANCGELQMVDGIGNNTAKKIKWSIRESIPAYGFEDEFPV